MRNKRGTYDKGKCAFVEKGGTDQTFIGGERGLLLEEEVARIKKKNRRMLK